MAPTPSTNAVDRHLRQLTYLATLSRILAAALIYASSYLPPFDASSRTLLLPSTPRLTSSLLRWDNFHFASIARDGYLYEQQWAFLPGLPTAMKIIGFVVGLLHGKRDARQPLGWEELVQAGAIGALVCSSTRSLYRLSLYHLQSPYLAFLATLLSLLPNSPATAHYAGYTEPFFTFLSYRGMLACARKQYIYASLYFALATGFRSNGTLLAGYIFWSLVVEPLIIHRNPPSVPVAILSVVLSTIVVAPFVYHQYQAYLLFCSPTDMPAHLSPWCANFPPVIYTYVQSKYWNVGILRYWTLPQLPNILLAVPVLSILSAFSLYHLKTTTRIITLRYFSLTRLPADSAFADFSLIPYTIHTVIICLVLLFSSHTQIVLRLAPSLPTTYWAAAWLLVSHRPIGRAWVIWSVIWGAVSAVLWGVFLPPA